MQGFLGRKTLVCGAFLHIKPANRLETGHSKNAFSTPGLKASCAQVLAVRSVHGLRLFDWPSGQGDNQRRSALLKCRFTSTAV